MSNELQKFLKENNQPALVAQTSNELQVKQTEALTVLAAGVQTIATFLTNGGLTSLLSGYARSQAVKDILGGLATHDGRNALDARVLGQNAVEIVHAVEAVFEKYQERLSSKEVRDPEVHDAEKDLKEWQEKHEHKTS